MKKYRIDLHVHTNRYSQCAETLDPEKLSQAASDAGLDGLVLTEHDAIWAEEELRILNQKNDHDIKIYRGVEVSSADGHFVVIGLPDMSSISVGISAQELFAKSRIANAVVIFVHPQRPGSSSRLFNEQKNWHKYVDAIEVASTYTLGRHEIDSHVLAEGAGLPKVAGSDAHSLSKIGLAFTELDFLPPHELALAKAIRENSCSPQRSK